MGLSSITLGSQQVLKNLKKTALSSAGMTVLFSIFEFKDVPSAFKLDIDSNGQKVEGLNMKSGGKELAKSVIKSAGYIAVPMLLTAPFIGAGALVASIAGTASFLSTFKLASFFEENMPSEVVLAENMKKELMEEDPNKPKYA